MVYRKGELQSSTIDQGWPHQIVLPAEAHLGANYHIIHDFCRVERLSLCERGHALKRGPDWFTVFCFATRADAETFQGRFGGDWFDRRGWNARARADYMAAKGMRKVRGRWVPIESRDPIS